MVSALGLVSRISTESFDTLGAKKDLLVMAAIRLPAYSKCISQGSISMFWRTNS